MEDAFVVLKRLDLVYNIYGIFSSKERLTNLVSQETKIHQNELILDELYTDNENIGFVCPIDESLEYIALSYQLLKEAKTILFFVRIENDCAFLCAELAYTITELLEGMKVVEEEEIRFTNEQMEKLSNKSSDKNDGFEIISRNGNIYHIFFLVINEVSHYETDFDLITEFNLNN